MFYECRWNIYKLKHAEVSARFGFVSLFECIQNYFLSVCHTFQAMFLGRFGNAASTPMRYEYGSITASLYNAYIVAVNIGKYKFCVYCFVWVSSEPFWLTPFRCMLFWWICPRRWWDASVAEIYVVYKVVTILPVGMGKCLVYCIVWVCPELVDLS